MASGTLQECELPHALGPPEWVPGLPGTEHPCPLTPEVRWGRCGAARASRQSRKGVRAGAEHGGVFGGGGRAGRRGEPPGFAQGAGVCKQLPGSRVRGSCPGGGPRQGARSARPASHLSPLGRAQNVKQLYALVCETQRYSAVLDAVIANAGLLRAEKKLRPHLAKVTGG